MKTINQELTSSLEVKEAQYHELSDLNYAVIYNECQTDLAKKIQHKIHKEIVIARHELLRDMQKIKAQIEDGF